MTPALRLSFSLVLSLLVWLPTIPSALANAEDPARIAVRYLIALLVSRVGVGIVFRIVNAYHVEPEPQPEPEAELDEAVQFDAYGRRREDFAEEPTAEDLLDEALEDAADQQTAMVN